MRLIKSCHTHFSHPILGTYEVIQFFELVNLEGTPFQCGIWASYQFHDTMGWKSQTISLSFQYHVTSYHTSRMMEAFQFQSKPYHHSKAVTGWGPFYKIWKIFLQAVILVYWAPFLVDILFRFFLTFEATSGGYVVNLTLGKWAQLGLIQGFGPVTMVVGE